MLSLRLLNDSDIPRVETWLNKDHVKKWYEIPRLNVTIDDWMSEIKERDGEFSWITYLIAQYNDCPIGFCQYYKCSDSTDEDFGTLLIEGSYGIDYLIGEEEYIGKGFGKKLIALLADKIFALPDTERVTADIDMENKASGNALLSCGFKLLDADSSRFMLPREVWEIRNK